MDIIIPAEKRLHKEKHLHHCPIHARNKCHHERMDIACNNCLKLEDNEVCQKTLRGARLESHVFPCMNCMMMWRNQYGGETMIDAFIDLEQAARLAHVAPNASVDEREEREAQANSEVEELRDAISKV